MLDKQIIGALSVILTLIGYAPYFWSIYKGRTKPHIFSWTVWTITNAVVFYAQLTKGAGAGAWVTGAVTVLSLLVTVSSIWVGEKTITRGDWFSFIGALTTVPLWYFTQNPLGAVILATLVDMLGCYPTLRKSYSKPFEESAAMWSLATARSVLSIFALANYTLVTAFNPFAMVLTNGSIAGMVLLRRMQTR